jgi:hypothetical protein
MPVLREALNNEIFLHSLEDFGIPELQAVFCSLVGKFTSSRTFRRIEDAPILRQQVFFRHYHVSNNTA